MLRVTGHLLGVKTWWRHHMETLSALLALCVGYSPVPGEFPAQRTVTRSFDVFFDLRPNKRLSKQLWRCWFETLSSPLWRHCYDIVHLMCTAMFDTGTLKPKCHFHKIVITGWTGSCQHENFQCRQWWKFRQIGDIYVLVLISDKTRIVRSKPRSREIGGLKCTIARKFDRDLVHLFDNLHKPY